MGQQQRIGAPFNIGNKECPKLVNMLLRCLPGLWISTKPACNSVQKLEYQKSMLRVISTWNHETISIYDILTIQSAA